MESNILKNYKLNIFLYIHNTPKNKILSSNLILELAAEQI